MKFDGQSKKVIGLAGWPLNGVPSAIMDGEPASPLGQGIKLDRYKSSVIFVPFVVSITSVGQAGHL